MKKDSICVITLSDSESEFDGEELIKNEKQNHLKIEDESNMNKGESDIIVLDESSDTIVIDDSSVVESTLPFTVDRVGSLTLPEFIPVYNSPPRCKKKKKTFSKLRKQIREPCFNQTNDDYNNVITMHQSAFIEPNSAMNCRLEEADNSVELITSTEPNITSIEAKNMPCKLKKALKKFKKQSTLIPKRQNEVQNATITAKRKSDTECESIDEKKSRVVKFKPKNKIIHLTQSNALIPKKKCTRGLRPIIIDGLNVARGFGLGEFKFKGIVIVVQYFESRGHDEIVCFLPHHYRGKIDSDSGMENVKKRFEKNRILTYTPSRVINGKRISPYDDRYIVQYAAERKGVIITNDSYKDLLMEADWKETIEQRIINFTFTRGEGLMLPRDPLGYDGPTLDEILRFPNS